MKDISSRWTFLKIIVAKESAHSCWVPPEKEMVSRGGKRMVLETATTNSAAIALWEKHGYRELGIMISYYGSGLDAFRMGKELVAVRDRSAS